MGHPENDPEDLQDLPSELRERIKKSVNDSLKEHWPKLRAQTEISMQFAQKMAGLWATTAKIMVDAFVAQGFSEEHALKLTIELIPKRPF